MRIALKKNNIACIFWCISIAAYMFQCYWRSLATLIVPSLIIFLILEIPNIKFLKVNGWILIYGIYGLYLIFSTITSLIVGNSIGSVLRFFLILMAIPVAGLVNENEFEKEWIILKILALIKAGTILYTWCVVFISQNYAPYRAWARGIGAGDIYIINGIPRVQLLGTSLFVIIFACDFIKRKKITGYNLLILLAALAAGNSAYVLGIAIFFVFYFLPRVIMWIQKRNWKLMLFIPISMIFLLGFSMYSVNALKLKSENSNPVRFEQVEVLTNTNAAFGNGVGHSVTGGGKYRTYNGDTYFELQTLYIYNQIGLIGIALFYLLTCSIYSGKKNYLKQITYITYLIYTFWNPYCFDSTHIFTMLLISNCIRKRDYSI